MCERWFCNHNISLIKQTNTFPTSEITISFKLKYIRLCAIADILDTNGSLAIVLAE